MVGFLLVGVILYCLYLYSYIIIHLVIRFVKPFYNIF